MEIQEKRRLDTDYNLKENGSIRYTDKYLIYSYEEIDKFKEMISMAMSKGIYSSKIFEMMSDKV